MSSFLPIRVQSICPYCTHSQDIDLGRAYPHALLVQCSNPSCTKQWHEGSYLAAVLQIEHYTKRGRGKNQPTVHIIRSKGGVGKKRFLTFSSTKNLMMKKGDIIGLSIQKQSQGTLRKQWTGEWEKQPEILFNTTISYYWNI